LLQASADCVLAAPVLAVETGSVMVDEGKGFSAVVGTKQLPAGARIILKAGSVASLGDDTTKCSVSLPSERVLTVPAAVPCTSKISTSSILDTKTQPPSYVSGHPEPVQTGGIDASTLAAGAGVAGAVGLGVLISANTSKKHSASP
jgi:hypothetical protein